MLTKIRGSTFPHKPCTETKEDLVITSVPSNAQIVVKYNHDKPGKY